ncbi:uncharacterized protein LOC106643904 [Copidosoma floridanum]|uniref:uncharacterized protein LOC106643904 n=1 Tax=Copidosoma floridanum TaxID=29053 RepID=UPI0006C970C1|nr:uncharacterized protein LOC106643904 [Copidosoma floridanum]
MAPKAPSSSSARSGGNQQPRYHHQQQHHQQQRLSHRLLLLGLALNCLNGPSEHSSVGAEVVGPNANTLDRTLKPLDVDLPPTLPMSFGTHNSTVIRSQSGSTAHLPCVVHNIGEGVVTWIRRKKDHQLLTVGLTTYASDERFQTRHFQHSEDWTLQIKYVQNRDAGVYECQVSTHPPTSIFLILEVVEARAEIVGKDERYLRPGSTLQLHCVVKNSTEQPSFLFWYHNKRMVNYDNERGVNVSTDLVGRESWLEVPRTTSRHSGNYTCDSSNATPGRVVIHIFDGDNPAAMQHSLASSPSIVVCSALMTLSTALKLALQHTYVYAGS